MKKRLTLVRILIILIIIFGVLYISRNAEEKISNAIAIITAILGFLAIIYQLNMDHSIKRAEFIYSLNDSFNSDELIAKSYAKLKQNRHSEIQFTEKEISDMGSYIMFFVIMNYLVSRNLVKLKMIDKIFANKFFLLCHNPYVQEQQLSKDHIIINYPVMELYAEWYNYRVVNGLPVLYDKYCYANNKEIFTIKKDFITYNYKEKKTAKFYLRKLFHLSNMPN